MAWNREPPRLRMRDLIKLEQARLDLGLLAGSISRDAYNEAERTLRNIYVAKYGTEGWTPTPMMQSEALTRLPLPAENVVDAILDARDVEGQAPHGA